MSKRSKEAFEKDPYYPIKIINRNIICNQIGNWTIEFTGNIKQRSNNFSLLSKTSIRYCLCDGLCKLHTEKYEVFHQKLEHISHTTTVESNNQSRKQLWLLRITTYVAQNIETQILDNNNNPNHVEQVSPIWVHHRTKYTRLRSLQLLSSYPEQRRTHWTRFVRKRRLTTRVQPKHLLELQLACCA